MVSASGGTRRVCMNEASNFSISAFCAADKVAPSQLVARVPDLLQHVTQLAGGAFRGRSGIVEFMRDPAESFPRDANRSRCCSIRVVSRIRSDIRPTRRCVNSGIFCTSSGNSEAGNRRARLSVIARAAHRKLLHPRKRQHSRNVARLRSEDKSFASELAPPLKMSLKNHKHGIRRIALARIRHHPPSDSTLATG